MAAALNPSGDIVDVWSRTEPKYRRRAFLLLGVNLGLFCGLCAFSHWLHVGRLIDFSWESYVAPARLSGEGTQNLNDFVLFPISVVQVPMHAVVLGLLFAAIVAVPMIITMLYRLGAALPFVAAVLVFGHLPWMALTLLTSCVLIRVSPFRYSFRFGSALLGMLPVLAYMYLATRGTPDEMFYASPTQKSLMAAPWVLAILAACAMIAAALLVSRAVNYRPGAVAPMVACMFLVPVAVFHAQVGADELQYRVLEREFGPRARRFEPVRDAQADIHSVVSGLDRAHYYYLREIWSGRVTEA